MGEEDHRRGPAVHRQEVAPGLRARERGDAGHRSKPPVGLRSNKLFVADSFLSEPIGFTAGSTSIGATLGGFDDGSPLAFLLLSSAPGDLVLPFGDGRALGLALTPLFLQSVNVGLAGPLAAALAPDGSGALTLLAVPPLPPGTLHAAAVALDLATLSFGDVSDVVALEL